MVQCWSAQTVNAWPRIKCSKSPANRVELLSRASVPRLMKRTKGTLLSVRMHRTCWLICSCEAVIACTSFAERLTFFSLSLNNARLTYSCQITDAAGHQYQHYAIYPNYTTGLDQPSYFSEPPNGGALAEFLGPMSHVHLHPAYGIYEISWQAMLVVLAPNSTGFPLTNAASLATESLVRHVMNGRSAGKNFDPLLILSASPVPNYDWNHDGSVANPIPVIGGPDIHQVGFATAVTGKYQRMVLPWLVLLPGHEDQREIWSQQIQMPQTPKPFMADWTKGHKSAAARGAENLQAKMAMFVDEYYCQVNKYVANLQFPDDHRSFLNQQVLPIMQEKLKWYNIMLERSGSSLVLGNCAATFLSLISFPYKYVYQASKVLQCSRRNYAPIIAIAGYPKDADLLARPIDEVRLILKRYYGAKSCIVWAFMMNHVLGLPESSYLGCHVTEIFGMMGYDEKTTFQLYKLLESDEKRGFALSIAAEMKLGVNHYEMTSERVSEDAWGQNLREVIGDASFSAVLKKKMPSWSFNRVMDSLGLVHPEGTGRGSHLRASLEERTFFDLLLMKIARPYNPDCEEVFFYRNAEGAVDIKRTALIQGVTDDQRVLILANIHDFKTSGDLNSQTKQVLAGTFMFPNSLISFLSL